MKDWVDYFREKWHDPLFIEVFAMWERIMRLERGNKFPFYIFPNVKKGDGMLDTFLLFVDNLVDAHETERNPYDANKDFYHRAYYVGTNIFRLQNDTLSNMMFDTQLPKPQYDRMNNAIATRTGYYMGLMTAFHTASLAGISYFFRYRKLTILP